MRGAFRAVVLAGMFYAEAAFGADFSGVWELDLGASDSPVPMMEATGASWMERTAAKSMGVTQTITQTSGSVTIAVDSAAHDRLETLPLDGSPFESVDRHGEPVSSSTKLVGESMVTTSTAKLEDGRKVPVVITRSLQDGGATLVQVVKMEVDPAKPMVMRRVFRKKK